MLELTLLTSFAGLLRVPTAMSCGVAGSYPYPKLGNGTCRRCNGLEDDKIQYLPFVVHYLRNEPTRHCIITNGACHGTPQRTRFALFLPFTVKGRESPRFAGRLMEIALVPTCSHGCDTFRSVSLAVLVPWQDFTRGGIVYPRHQT